MVTHPKKYLLDTNVLDRLCDNDDFANLVYTHQHCNEYEFLISWIQVDELNEIRNQIGKLWRFRDLGMTLMKLTYTVAPIPLVKSIFPSEETEFVHRNYWQKVWLELFARHPFENDSLLALTAISQGAKVVTDDHTFIKHIPETVLPILNFHQGLVRHNLTCRGSIG
jgi:predicted nucleic acid-binding protein